jgi:hypothetical protein
MSKRSAKSQPSLAMTPFGATTPFGAFETFNEASLLKKLSGMDSVSFHATTTRTSFTRHDDGSFDVHHTHKEMAGGGGKKPTGRVETKHVKVDATGRVVSDIGDKRKLKDDRKGGAGASAKPPHTMLALTNGGTSASRR